jgi:hypothetical protein
MIAGPFRLYHGPDQIADVRNLVALAQRFKELAIEFVSGNQEACARRSRFSDSRQDLVCRNVCLRVCLDKLVSTNDDGVKWPEVVCNASRGIYKFRVVADGIFDMGASRAVVSRASQRSSHRRGSAAAAA